jgi:chromosome segregation ATPase
MLGTIEELEKDIELFQKNVAASEELQTLLKQMLEEIRNQNSDFNAQSTALVSRVDNLPAMIENANISSNTQVKNDVASEVDRALQSFADNQNRYLQGLEQTKQQIQTYLEETKNQKKEFSDETAAVLAKWDTVLESVVTENHNTNVELKADMDKLLSGKVAEFSAEQGKYIDELQRTQESLQNCESQLNAKYKEFIGTLEKMNISNIYEQNVQLKAELNKRTTILMVISIISIVVGIFGIIF